MSDRYVQDARSVSAWYSYTGTRYQAQTRFHRRAFPSGAAPAILVERISASPAMFWQTVYSEYRAS